jgi:hypothetical protein
MDNTFLLFSYLKLCCNANILCENWGDYEYDDLPVSYVVDFDNQVPGD